MTDGFFLGFHVGHIYHGASRLVTGRSPVAHGGRGEGDVR